MVRKEKKDVFYGNSTLMTVVGVNERRYLLTMRGTVFFLAPYTINKNYK